MKKIFFFLIVITFSRSLFKENYKSFSKKNVFLQSIIFKSKKKWNVVINGKSYNQNNNLIIINGVSFYILIFDRNSVLLHCGKNKIKLKLGEKIQLEMLTSEIQIDEQKKLHL